MRVSKKRSSSGILTEVNGFSHRIISHLLRFIPSDRATALSAPLSPSPMYVLTLARRVRFMMYNVNIPNMQLAIKGPMIAIAATIVNVVRLAS